jgi:hypothetical protein
MRSLASQWMTEVRIDDAFHRRWWGSWSASFKDEQLERAFDRARSDSLRCLRAEALLPLAVIRNEGTRSQRQRAGAALSALAHDRDATLASIAEWLERQPYKREEYLGMQP